MSTPESVLALDTLPDWERALRRRGLKPASLAQHRTHLRACLADAASVRGCPPDELLLREITPELLGDALAVYRFRDDARFADGASPPAERSLASVRARLTALRSWTRFLLDTERTSRDLASSCQLPTTPPAPPRALSEDEARDVLRAAALARFASRDRLIAALVLTMGCSLRELAALQLRSVHLPGPGQLRVEGRAGRTRTLSISQPVADALEEYLPERDRLLARFGVSTPLLLCSARTGEGLTEAGVAAVLTRCLQGAGVVERGVRVHALRATFASLALAGGYSLPQLGHSLGTSSLDALRRITLAGELDAPPLPHPLSRP